MQGPSISDTSFRFLCIALDTTSCEANNVNGGVSFQRRAGFEQRRLSTSSRRRLRRKEHETLRLGPGTVCTVQHILWIIPVFFYLTGIVQDIALLDLDAMKTFERAQFIEHQNIRRVEAAKALESSMEKVKAGVIAAHNTTAHDVWCIFMHRS